MSKEVTIKKYSLTGVSRNKSLFAKLETEESDEIYSIFNGLEYLATKKVGDKITLNKSGNFYNIEIPDNFIKFLQSDKATTRIFINMFQNFSQSIINEQFGDRIDITEEEAIQRIKHADDEYEYVRNLVMNKITESDMKFDKEIFRQLNLKKASQTIDPMLEIERKIQRLLDGELKGYNIIPPQGE